MVLVTAIISFKDSHSVHVLCVMVIVTKIICIVI